MPKRLLVITDTIDENNGSGAKANLALIHNLAACGYIVTVIHFTGREITREGVTCKEVPIRKWNVLYVMFIFTKLINRHLGWNPNTVIENIFGFSAEFYNTSRSIRKYISKQYQPTDFDLVLTLSKGTSFRPHFALLNLPFWHTKWLAYIHDPYPFHLYPRPYRFRQIGFRQKEHFFKKMSKKARWFGFPSKLLQDWMGYDFPEMHERGVVIPHQLTPYHPPAVSLDSYLTPGKMVFVHAGNLMKARTPIPLIKAFSRLLNTSTEAAQHMELLLVGGSDFSLSELTEASKNYSSIRFELTSVPFHIAYQLQQQASVNIIIEADAHISPFLPGKFPHCVAANKPILLLSPYYSETRNLLGKEYPFWSETNDEEKIYQLLLQLLEDWKRNQDMRLLNYEQHLNYLSKDYLKQRIDNIMQ